MFDSAECADDKANESGHTTATKDDQTFLDMVKDNEFSDAQVDGFKLLNFNDIDEQQLAKVTYTRSQLLNVRLDDSEEIVPQKVIEFGLTKMAKEKLAELLKRNDDCNEDERRDPMQESTTMDGSFVKVSSHEANVIENVLVQKEKPVESNTLIDNQELSGSYDDLIESTESFSQSAVSTISPLVPQTKLMAKKPVAEEELHDSSDDPKSNIDDFNAIRDEMRNKARDLQNRLRNMPTAQKNKCTEPIKDTLVGIESIGEPIEPSDDPLESNSNENDNRNEAQNTLNEISKKILGMPEGEFEKLVKTVASEVAYKPRASPDSAKAIVTEPISATQSDIRDEIRNKTRQLQQRLRNLPTANRSSGENESVVSSESTLTTAKSNDNESVVSTATRSDIRDEIRSKSHQLKMRLQQLTKKN